MSVGGAKPEVHDMLVDPALLGHLRSAAESADRHHQWPAESLKHLCDAGVTAWNIPREYAGAGRGPLELLSGYEQLAGACLTTAFILSQREGAVRRLVASPNTELTRRFLPALARGELFASVGVSQLTTSRQHLAPTMTVTDTAHGFQLNGVTQWVTGAKHADLLVIGATLADGRQVLLGLPRAHAGANIGLPLELMALAGSGTCTVECHDVVLGHEWLIAGPAERVMAGKAGGVGGLETSSLALGLAGAAVDFVAQEANQRPDLSTVVQRLQNKRRLLRIRLHTLATAAPTQESMIAIRVDCTTFALQATQVAMTIAKGAGFVSPHPVQRWARQALFFLVWSCPRPAAEGLMEQLLPGDTCN